MRTQLVRRIAQRLNDEDIDGLFELAGPTASCR
jgi:hypothetical protein